MVHTNKTVKCAKAYLIQCFRHLTSPLERFKEKNVHNMRALCDWSMENYIRNGDLLLH